jgi:hypothetical protein
VTTAFLNANLNSRLFTISLRAYCYSLGFDVSDGAVDVVNLALRFC